MNAEYIFYSLGQYEPKLCQYYDSIYDSFYYKLQMQSHLHILSNYQNMNIFSLMLAKM